MNDSNIPEVCYWEAYLGVQQNMSEFLWLACLDDLEAGLDLAIKGAVTIKSSINTDIEPFSQLTVKSTDPLHPPFSYEVNLIERTCGCAYFKHIGHCKHYIAGQLHVIAYRKAADWMAEYLNRRRRVGETQAAYQLTTEQEKVIHHPIGQHARVLAVAGSGKSTTMAHRIKYLVLEEGILPASMRVLMFNALARQQFITHLDRVCLSQTLQPAVHTFHSYCFHFISQMTRTGILPASTQFWLADKAELIWLTVKRAIRNLEKANRIPEETIDPEEALNAIGLWKGALIPPERAGSYTSPSLPLVYAEYERMRLKENALTFEDFVPTTVEILSSHPDIHQLWCQELRHIIVDEFQDINFGQQALLELLAGNIVDMMVVGDDDQTVYEWRGARPNYIIRDFNKVFSNKPIQDYRLSRSFRFGPLIAQCAANVIACNSHRVEKHLVAFQSAKPGFVQISNGGYNATKELTEQVIALIKGDMVPPSEIIVLARLYAQLDNLEAEFLARKIPYRVDGKEPFFKRREINVLLDYLRLARDYQEPITDIIGLRFLNVANKPPRMLSRSLLNKLVNKAKYRKLSVEKLMEAAICETSFGLSGWQQQRLAELWDFLEMTKEKLQDPAIYAGSMLDWMVDELAYLSYFENYYGEGLNADEKKYAVLNFLRYVSQHHIRPLELIDHLARLDTTQGAPEKEQVVFTTIFRTKGLEYDYVVVPRCDENLLPYLKGERTDVYDTQGIVQESRMSTALENERRLFYVALTRARVGVLIGSSVRPSRFLQEMSLQETEAVMEAVQWLASGDGSARKDLLNALQEGGAIPDILENLTNGYLPDIAQMKLAKHIQRTWAMPVTAKEVEKLT